MEDFSVLTESEKKEAAADGMLRAAARKGFNQGVVVGALIAAATSVICTVIEHCIDLAKEDEEDDKWDDMPF